MPKRKRRRCARWHSSARTRWAVHAATHVMEMQGRIDEGIAWLDVARGRLVARTTAFAYHNWWHLALFHLDRGDATTTRSRSTTRTIHPGPAQFALSLVDATALLWRLHARRRGRRAARFATVADEWEARLDQDRGYYAFNDVHAMLAFVGDGTRGRERSVSRRPDAGGGGQRHQRDDEPRGRACRSPRGSRRSDAAATPRRIGLIEPVRDVAHRFGGSHAQRDLITLTLIEAALRDGQASRARHFIAERLVHKPASRWGRRLADRAAARSVQ